MRSTEKGNTDEQEYPWDDTKEARSNKHEHLLKDEPDDKSASWNLTANEVAKIVARVTKEKWLAISSEEKEYLLDRKDITLNEEASHIWS